MVSPRLVGALLAIACIGAVWAAAAQKADQEDHALRQLLEARAEAAAQCAQATQAAYEAETVITSDLLLALDKLVEARLAIARTQRERVLAANEHLTRLEKLEQHVKRLHDISARGGEANTYALVKVYRLSAEIALIEARRSDKQ